jgi:hypothetical protein
MRDHPTNRLIALNSTTRSRILSVQCTRDLCTGRCGESLVHYPRAITKRGEAFVKSDMSLPEIKCDNRERPDSQRQKAPKQARARQPEGGCIS